MQPSLCSRSFPKHFLTRLVMAGMLCLWWSTAHAQIQLDRFYPPAVSIDQETVIQAEGKFPTWPVQVVCDRDELEIRAAKESGKLKIRVPADAAPGVIWLRVHDQTSASKLCPLLIEPAAVVLETEPNNEIAAANAPPSPGVLAEVLAGRLEKSGDVDTFRVQVRAG
ncbi:MAG: hypothetical protein MI861_26520, partial [Pirellulales bacterium]|nr:hypothetical protein [Pirellulales bacterium]